MHTQQLTEQLNVDQSAIRFHTCLEDMRKTYKIEKWVPHELMERQQENRKHSCEWLLAKNERKSFLHRNIIGDEK